MKGPARPARDTPGEKRPWKAPRHSLKTPNNTRKVRRTLARQASSEENAGGKAWSFYRWRGSSIRKVTRLPLAEAEERD